MSQYCYFSVVLLFTHDASSSCLNMGSGKYYCYPYVSPHLPKRKPGSCFLPPSQLGRTCSLPLSMGGELRGAVSRGKTDGNPHDTAPYLAVQLPLLKGSNHRLVLDPPPKLIVVFSHSSISQCLPSLLKTLRLVSISSQLLLVIYFLASRLWPVYELEEGVII